MTKDTMRRAIGFYLTYINVVIAAAVLCAGLYIWLGNSIWPSETDDELTWPFDNILGLYFFVKCLFCSIVLWIGGWVVQEKVIRADRHG